MSDPNDHKEFQRRMMAISSTEYASKKRSKYYADVKGTSLSRDLWRGFGYLIIGGLIMIIGRAVMLDLLLGIEKTAPHAFIIPTGIIITGLVWLFSMAARITDKLYYACMTLGVIITHFAQPFYFVAQPEIWAVIYGEDYVEWVVNTHGRLFGLGGR
ncbi:MAG: hypothetical protein ACPGGK_04545 [Pikeienuella sp.]